MFDMMCLYRYLFIDVSSRRQIQLLYYTALLQNQRAYVHNGPESVGKIRDGTRLNYSTRQLICFHHTLTKIGTIAEHPFDKEKEKVEYRKMAVI